MWGNDLNPLHADMREWRRHLHQFPEPAFEETRTAQFIAGKLAEFGLDVHQGLAKTGVDTQPVPSMGSEDVAFMLQEKPGGYIWIGNGPSADSCLLHNPHYDFNDDILPVGAAYWVQRVQTVLGAA